MDNYDYFANIRGQGILMREGRGEEMLQINWNVTVQYLVKAVTLYSHTFQQQNSFEIVEVIVACLKKKLKLA